MATTFEPIEPRVDFDGIHELALRRSSHRKVDGINIDGSMDSSNAGLWQ